MNGGGDATAPATFPADTERGLHMNTINQTSAQPSPVKADAARTINAAPSLIQIVLDLVVRSWMKASAGAPNARRCRQNSTDRPFGNVRVWFAEHPEIGTDALGVLALTITSWMIFAIAACLE